MRQNFSPHKHSFEDAPHNHSLLFIAHKRIVVYLYFEVKTTPYSGVISKKKKKGHRLFRCTFTICFGLNMPPSVGPTKCGPLFIFFIFYLEMLLQWQIFRGKYRDTYSNCPKNLKPAMRHLKPRNAPILAQCATVGHPCFRQTFVSSAFYLYLTS